MNIIFVPEGAVTDPHKRDIDIINEICLSGDADNPDNYEINMYDWDAPEVGKYLLIDGSRAVGRVAVHSVESVYDGQKYRLGGFGGLAVLPEYRGGGFGRKLAEMAIDKSRETLTDVMCMCVDTASGITDFYKRLGFRFLNRPAQFNTWNNRVKTDDTIMIMELLNPALAEKILSTDHVFSYGECKGHW